MIGKKLLIFVKENFNFDRLFYIIIQVNSKFLNEC